jgi:uncharacterized repeat protein (TIGR02543 family)
MSRNAHFVHRFMSLVLVTITLSCLLTAQTKRTGSGPGYGEITVGTDLHHDQSIPLRDMVPSNTPHHGALGTFPMPKAKRALPPVDADKGATAQVNEDSGVTTTLGFFNLAGVGNFFTGPNGTFTPATTPSDATGAVGTTQYFQWVDDAYAVFSKATGDVLIGPVPGNTIWSGFGGPCEADNDGQPTVNFDKLANRWVVSQYAMSSGPPYLQCVAVSTTADSTGTWNRYSFQIGNLNTSWINRDAKLGVWPDGYYMSFNMYSGTTFEGAKLCALQRLSMLLGQPAGIQCVQLQSQYYNPVVSDLESSTPPPAGAPAYFATDDVNFLALDFWKFHVDWNDSQDTTLSLPILVNEGNFNGACNNFGGPAACVPQPNGVNLTQFGSFVTGRMPYRNYGTYQSLLAAENAELVTGIRFYETRIASNGDLNLYQEGTFQPDTASYRFNSSIATDRAGNIAVAYNLSSSQTFPSQYAASRASGDPGGTLGNETLLNPGNGSQTTSLWNSRSSLTVDPIDDCTYYYTQQYEPMDGTNNWSTQIEDFTLVGCQGPETITLKTIPVNLSISAGGLTATAPFSGQFTDGSTLAIGTTSPQAGAAGVRYTFKGWSDGGAINHTIEVPAKGGTYTATFNTQYSLTASVAPAGSGKITPASGNFFNAGATVNLTATPAAGYAFTSWTGSVANANSATTTITMSAPQTVTANFTPLPTTVTAALIGKTGASNTRVWSFSFTNAGPGQANNVQINSFVLTQTAGTSCTPSLISALPVLVGNVAPGKVIDGKVSINFSSCGSTARFSLSMGSSENNGVSSSTLTLSNLAM